MEVFWVLVAGFFVVKTLQWCGKNRAYEIGFPLFWIAFSIYWTIMTMFHGMPWFILPVGPLFTGVGVVMLMRVLRK